MDCLCDEILQLVFYELPDPSALTMVSRRLLRFSQDPYVRAHYFLNHYGPVEAMYQAMSRGKLVTERVLDILLSSGAHLSRYLAQVAIHHFFYTQSHFIKTSWVREVPLKVFAHFLLLAEERYGEIPRGKGEDDGSTFNIFLKESRLPPHLKSVGWESIKSLMETYNFIPFSDRDPIMAQFPLALALEPRLLPYAVANGFSLDYKYRDFVFRKMFERPSPASEAGPADIAHNVQELCNLDPAMFVTRTVAAEICMEAKSNEIGYTALKKLDKSGHLRFELSTLVEDLLGTFLTTRSICTSNTGDVILRLFGDFPSADVSVRLVILVVIFLQAESMHWTPTTIRAKFEGLGIGIVTRKDIVNVLVNPFIEKYTYIEEFALREVGMKEDGSKGMASEQFEDLVEEVAAKCLEIACKGKLLKRLLEAYPRLKDRIGHIILQRYQIQMEDLPSWEDTACRPSYTATLCRDFLRYGMGEVHTLESLEPETLKQEPAEELSSDLEDHPISDASAATTRQPASGLGEITQETLSAMIRHDEIAPIRSRRRIMYTYGPSDSSCKLKYPADAMPVGKLAKSVFGARSAVLAVFMTHAVLNDNCGMLHHYLMYNDGSQSNTSSGRVPVTLKHFQLLARLGRAPNFYVWHDIEVGGEFYLDENDHLSKNNVVESPLQKKVKVETPQPNTLSSSPPTSSNRGKKRPRRTAAVSIRSYAVPDSDDEAIAQSDDPIDDYEEKKVAKESNLQLWIKHLSLLLKTETRKYNQIKKQLEKAAGPDTKIKVNKNDFIKSLATNLRTLRKIDAERRSEDHIHPGDEEYSEDEDDEDYMSRRKKRKTV
ncbi:hypothetical protein D9613_005940 [Agrocybe pediades]|uniref:Uncharacterized protein n=1 Tax=Agrocybe pediades TaxID=84607 RepID=A0A8H4VPF5_9AGAR|nr:hypothetical protein D9613_005940 [Agrocybe pediades]